VTVETGFELQRAPTWPELDEAVRQLIRTRRSVNTRRAYEADWERWTTFALRNGLDLKNPGINATTDFRDQLVGVNASSTVHRVLSTLSFIYSAFRDLGLLRTNPFARVWLPRPEVSDLHKTPAVEDADVAKLLAHLEGDISSRGIRDRAIICMLYDTGLRRESVAALKRDRIRREDGSLVAIVTVKGGKEKLVHFTPGAENALNAWLDVAPPSPFVFPQERPGRHGHLNLATVNRLVDHRCKTAGVTSKITPHRFRAAFITAAYDARIYERDIQDAAHHASADTTRGYDRGRRGDNVVTKIAEHRKGGRKP